MANKRYKIALIIIPMLLLLEQNRCSSFAPMTRRALPYVNCNRQMFQQPKHHNRQSQRMHMSSLTEMMGFMPKIKKLKSVAPQKIESPFDYVKDLVVVIGKAWENNINSSEQTKLLWPVSSGQKQLGLFERIGKVSHYSFVKLNHQFLLPNFTRNFSTKY